MVNRVFGFLIPVVINFDTWQGFGAMVYYYLSPPQTEKNTQLTDLLLFAL
jgi:hypothetical protein